MLRRFRLTTLVGTSIALLVPAVAQAHVSFHPNVLPSGAFATVVLRVPNEMDNATTTRVQTQLPNGFVSVSAQPPAGWTVAYKTQKLATPIPSDSGPITTEVREIDWTAAKGQGIPAGQFLQFPLSVLMPGKAGQVLSFPTVQTYSNNKIVRWIGTPSSDSPAPTVDISKANGPLLDVAGGEAGPSASAGTTALGASTSAAPATTVIHESAKGASKGLAVAALVVGALGLLAGLGGLLAARRARTAA
jgi:uncharacterized protein